MGEVLSDHELLDKQLSECTYKMRVCSGVTQAPASPRKVCDENERKKRLPC